MLFYLSLSFSITVSLITKHGTLCFKFLPHPTRYNAIISKIIFNQ